MWLSNALRRRRDSRGRSSWQRTAAAWAVLTAQGRGLWLSDCKFGVAWPLKATMSSLRDTRTLSLSLRGRNGVDWAGAAVARAETVLLAVLLAVGGRGKKISYRREAEDGQVVGNRGRGLLAC